MLSEFSLSNETKQSLCTGNVPLTDLNKVNLYNAPSNSTNNVALDPVVKRYYEESLGTFWGNGNVLPSLILDAEEKEKACEICGI